MRICLLGNYYCHLSHPRGELHWL